MLIDDKKSCTIPILLPVDEMMNDTAAPFDKVGAVVWKDLKMIQKEMNDMDWSQMVSLMPNNSSWKPGYLNDTVTNCCYVCT